ncbi:MAG: hypothetical protein Q7U64_08775 [Desulfocapsaceae bacterium]|jgi:hypothetical protein|nr:hypothetical protein [Desulfocapsaceae bacterium]
MNTDELKIEEETLLFPVEFLYNLENPPAVVKFLDKNNQYIQSEIVHDVVYDVQSGRYQVKENSPNKFQIITNKNSKIELIVSIVISQMRNELQFGNVLTYPSISTNFERMVLATLSDNDSHQFINKLSKHSNELVKRSIHACGLGIAFAIFLGYEDEAVKAVGLGCLLHEYGYLVDPSRHTISGSTNLEMTFFKNLNKYTNIVINIIEYHHAIRPHKSSQVNCGKIAIHWCSHINWDTPTRIQSIKARHHLYSEDIFDSFTRLYELMCARKAN